MKINEVVNEEVDVVQNIYHLKNRCIKVKKITDNLGNLPLMFRSFKYNDKPIEKIIKKVVNTPDREVRSGYNKEQKKILDQLGIKNPTFTSMAAGKYQDLQKSSFNEHPVQGNLNIFIPVTKNVYYSDYVHDLGSKHFDNNYVLNLDIDKIVKSYKKGWPQPNFDNEVIVDTETYYLLNLRSLLLELTSPEIKQQVSRIKKMMKTHSRADANHIQDILRDLFTTKVSTYSDISRWIETVTIPFIDMLIQSERNNA
jgi:hypothetical protein